MSIPLPVYVRTFFSGLLWVRSFVRCISSRRLESTDSTSRGCVVLPRALVSPPCRARVYPLQHFLLNPRHVGVEVPRTDGLAILGRRSHAPAPRTARMYVTSNSCNDTYKPAPPSISMCLRGAAATSLSPAAGAPVPAFKNSFVLEAPALLATLFQSFQIFSAFYYVRGRRV